MGEHRDHPAGLAWSRRAKRCSAGSHRLLWRPPSWPTTPAGARAPCMPRRRPPAVALAAWRGQHSTDPLGSTAGLSSMSAQLGLAEVCSSPCCSRRVIASTAFRRRGRRNSHVRPARPASPVDPACAPRVEPRSRSISCSHCRHRSLDDRAASPRSSGTGSCSGERLVTSRGRWARWPTCVGGRRSCRWVVGSSCSGCRGARAWWGGQIMMPSRLVSPPSAQRMGWCMWVMPGGESQPSTSQPPASMVLAIR